MHSGKIIFSQIIDHLSFYEFHKCVKRYNGNYKTRNFSCLDQFLCMSFAQLTYRESLRDIEACLRSMSSKLYHMGIRNPVSKSTLADANEKRDWRIYADFAQVLIREARELYAKEDLGLDIQNTVYALDASTIDLCLSLFPWAHFRKTKSAIKLHTLLDLRGNIPSFIKITEGNVHEVSILDQLIIEPGSFYIMDKGYLDFERLFQIHQSSGFFVIRAKSNFQNKRIYSHPVDKTTGLICDQTVMLTGFYSKNNYPEKIRRICFFDEETNKSYVFLTNNFSLPALTIAKLYKYRWKVELFFKWIKQNLRIKTFYGNSSNAVKLQVWIAISVYLLVAIIKKRLHLPHELYTILQILSVTAFEKVDLYQLLTKTDYETENTRCDNQLNLFDL